MELTRNKENEGKKRPVCVCGTEMTYVEYGSYYDDREFWICENGACMTKDDFKPDVIDQILTNADDRGAYA